MNTIMRIYDSNLTPLTIKKIKLCIRMGTGSRNLRGDTRNIKSKNSFLIPLLYRQVPHLWLPSKQFSFIWIFSQYLWAGENYIKAIKYPGWQILDLIYEINSWMFTVACRVAMNSKFWTNMNMNIIQSQKNFEYEYE